jgi:hypothetical protein
MKKEVQLTRGIIRHLASKDKNQEATLVDAQSPQQRQAQERDEEERDAHMERARLKLPTVLRKALKDFTSSEIGCLVACLSTVWGYSIEEELAPLFDRSARNLRVAKWRALKKHPCGTEPTVCARKPGCAHIRGALVLEALVRRLASDLR